MLAGWSLAQPSGFLQREVSAQQGISMYFHTNTGKKKKVFFSYQRLVLQGGVWEVFTEITSGWQLSAL